MAILYEGFSGNSKKVMLQGANIWPLRHHPDRNVIKGGTYISAKSESYVSINKVLESLIQGETDALANLSNSAALLFNSMEGVNWAGFYLYKEGQLVLGPFQGKPACIRIALGKGVCGTAAQNRESIVVGDVHQFPGHIACDTASASEIVVPIVKNGKLMGVLDIDSPVKSRFDEEDRQGLQKYVDILNTYIDWDRLIYL